MTYDDWIDSLRLDDARLNEIHKLDFYLEHGNTFAVCTNCDCAFSVNFASVEGSDCFTLEQVSGGDPLLCGEDSDE